MNFKTGACILAGGLVVVGVGFQLGYRSPRERHTAETPASKPEKPVPTPALPKTPPLPLAASLTNAPAPAAQPTNGLSSAVAAALRDIQKDFDSGDASAVADLLLKLEHPDKQVRKEALDILRQIDDRKAAPRLRELAATTTDLEEKAALLDTAEYLEMPELTEVIAGHKAADGSAPRTIRTADSPMALLRPGQSKVGLMLKQSQPAQTAPASQGQ